MLSVRWENGLLRGLGQALATVLVASTIIFLPAKVEPASATSDTVSEIDHYLDLNGTNQAAYGLENTPALNLGSSDWTVEAWIKPAALPGTLPLNDERMILNKELSYEFAIFNGTYHYALMPEDINFTWQYRDTGIAPLPDQWQHVAFAKSGNTLQFFLNGFEVYTVNDATKVPTSIRSSNLILSLGARESTTTGSVPTGAWIDGGIDEVRIWTERRTGNQIVTAMHQKLDGTQANLLAYWDFNEASGATVLDRGPNNLDLTLHNSPSRADVKKVSAASDGDTVITFPRTYLPGVGGWEAPESAQNARVLLVGGGGGGGAWIGGGGGAGGFRDETSVSITPGATYPVLVGQGGVGASFKANGPNTNDPVNWATRSPASGQQSVFGNLNVAGGGAGGSFLRENSIPPGSGGSGGGGISYLGNNSTASATGATPTDPSFGNRGGDGSGVGDASSIATAVPHPTGGGGGAGGAGQSAQANDRSGNGGPGSVSTIITGPLATALGVGEVDNGSVYFAGGGGGSLHGTGNAASYVAAAGGLGGGSDGTVINGAYPDSIAASNAMPNTGGGGGGSANFFTKTSVGGNGGSGVVIVRYSPITDQSLQIDGTTNTALGGNVSVIPSGAFTVEAWVFLTANNSRTILSQGSGVTSKVYIATLSNGNFYVAWGSEWREGEVSIAAPINQWAHVALTRTSGGTPKFYLNGIEFPIANSANTSNIQPGGNLYLGQQFNGTSPMLGQVDQVKVWSVDLSASELVASMHTYGATQSSGVAVKSGATLFAHYDFNEAWSGSIEPDRTGNAKHLNKSEFTTPSQYTSSSIIETGSPSLSERFVKFNRSYLTATGGWTPTDGVTTYRGLAVAGGGGGGGTHGGGGGAGELAIIQSLNISNPTVIKVGQGGLGFSRGAIENCTANKDSFPGQDSVIGNIILSGGGAGINGCGDRVAGDEVGGSGGGSPYPGTPAGTSDKNNSTATISYFGNIGGVGANWGASIGEVGGGGGGAGSAGGAGVENERAGNGGTGLASTISGALVCYAAGGGGGARNFPGVPPAAPGGSCSGTAAVGGAGGVGATRGADGAQGTGSGGGGGGVYESGATRLTGLAGNGGSGVVILAYSLAPDAPTSLTATQSTSHATINLSWSAPTYTGNSAITDYDIEYKPAGGSWTSYSDGVSAATTRAVELPTQCVAHEFRVIAKNSSFGSVASATASATPVWGTFDSLTGVQISSNSGCVIKFTDVGSANWTPPADVTTVEAIAVGAGGGGGGGGHQSSGIAGGGGGGAAGLVVTGSVAVTPNQPVSLTVGAGGTGGAGADNNPSWIGVSGSAGSASAFGLLSASGGEGGWGGGKPAGSATSYSGRHWIDGTGGQGGSNSSFSPGNGYSIGTDGGSGAGGGGAGSSGNGTAATGNGNNFGVGGAGTTVDGVQLAVGGNGGKGGDVTTATAAAATPNTGNGGNGGDGLSASQAASPYSGAAGASGLVIVYQIFVSTPSITSHPQSVSAEPGQTRTLTVVATGNGTLSYQWQSSTDGTNWSNVGTNASSLTTPTLGLADTGIRYRVGVTNTLNGQTSTVTSSEAAITVTGVSITAGSCTAMVGNDAGVTISETANGGCLVEYTTPGSNTFFIPNQVSSLQAFIVGGGGGGGGAKLDQGGGGGGGGAASRVVTLAVTASQVLPVTVGAGGAGGNAEFNGSNGGSTSISSSFVVAGGNGGKTPPGWPPGGGQGGSGASTNLATSGASGGAGATDPGDRSYYQPRFGNAGSNRIFAGEYWCVGGGAGGGNREVANDAYFHWEPRSQFCSDGTSKPGGSGGWHNGTTNVLPTSGEANRGGGGGGGSYDSNLRIARAGAAGADGVVAIYYVQATGEISLSTVAAVSFSDTTHAITLTKDNNTTDVTWTTSNTAVCTIASSNSTGATIQEEAAGLCEVSVVVAANQAQSYGRGTAATSFQIDKISRSTPTWSNGVTSVSVPFGSSLDLRPRLSQPGESYTFSTSGTVGSCSVTGYTLNVGNVGDTCNVTPTLLGNAIYLDMVGATALSVTVTKISQSALVLTSGNTMNVNQTLTLSAAGGSGTGAISYQVASQGGTGCVADPTTGALTATAAGSCEVYAQRAGSTNYDPVTSSHVVVTINKVSQNLSWLSQPQAQYLAGQTYALEATASSQLTVAYSISAGLCTIAGATVTFTGSGDCVILAGQSGDHSYLPAVTISQTVSVGKINQTMTFSALANVSWGSLAFSLSATASSGLNIVYSENNQTTNDACDVSANGIVTIKNVGTCAITATQAGNSAYTAVTTTRLFEVTANQAGAPFIGSVSFGDRQLNASFFTPSYLGGGNVSAYQMIAYKLDGTVAATNSGCIASPGPTQSCSVIGLENGVKYVLKVAAITEAGIGSYSASSSEIIPASNPEAVGNLLAIEGNGQLSLQWTQPSSFGGGSFFQYRIYWRAPGQQYQADGSPGATVGTQASTSYVITGLTNGIAYDVKIVTATSNNNVELQSNTAEVRQTPFTVPDAPAAVVALDNNNNVVVAWQPPVFDGGNPIDQYVVTKGNSTVCTITSATTTSCEVTRPAPGSTEVIQVRAGNDAGLSAPASTSITIQAVQGSSTPIVGGGGVSLPGITPNTPAPIVLDVTGSAVVKTNEVVKLVGSNFNLVEKVLIGDVEASFFVNSAGLITIRIPIEVAAGNPTITLQGAFGSAIFANLIEVSVTQVSIDTKVTIGTFLGYAAIYTKNHDGKRLSMKIGNKWRVIESLGGNYTYNYTKVGVGRTVTVEVYIDRVLVQVKQIKIQ